MKSYKVIIPMCVMTFLSACGGASNSSEKKSSANDVSSSVVTNTADLKLDEELLANKNNTAGGYFVFQESVYNSGKMKIVKIAPELYETK